MSREDTNNLLDFINSQTKVIQQLKKDLAAERSRNTKLQNKLNSTEISKCS